jgi:CRP/FNR family transcriptional regulator
MSGDVSSTAIAAYAALAGLPPALRARFNAGAQIFSAPVGAVLFEPGSPCQAFPIVLEGAIRVARLAENGREIVLYRVSPGEPCVVTTHCLLGRGEYPARGTVESPVTAVAVPLPLFDDLLAGHAPFRQALLADFADRIVSLMTLVEEVAFTRLDARLAALLTARPSPIRATHQALAADLGSIREIVSRLLKQFETRGWVALGRERIDVLNAAALRRLAQGDDGRASR